MSREAQGQRSLRVSQQPGRGFERPGSKGRGGYSSILQLIFVYFELLKGSHLKKKLQYFVVKKHPEYGRGEKPHFLLVVVTISSILALVKHLIYPL